MDANQIASLSDQVRARLEELIRSGAIQPGERLVELQLARVFAVSRSPVRRALVELEAGGLITSQGRRGYLVNGEARSDSGGSAHVDDINLDQSRHWERIYASVEQDVLTQMLYQPIKINEVRLAEHFEVSRTVTRDVLARMHGLGLIAKSRSGAWIANQLTSDTIRDLYELRELLEPRALKLVAPRLEPRQIEQAKMRIREILRNEIVDGASFDRIERDLHIDIIGACPNKEIVTALKRTHVLFAPTRHLLDPVLGIPLSQIEDALKEHLEILEHLASGSAKAAADHLAAHLSGAIDRWLGRLDHAGPSCVTPMPVYLSAFKI
ncbi:GntR family transcriptional regulator [Aureimonas fodinaquatilis]|uniref:GntR family transcriptional regulator n=1 Tax=Aureimonas fodinaquatilis TaxID=2565783 RepID=A0A5B0E0D5_9HYPH|nr:GntR family transcriptional regulator [Aureimonas fodinaquatilis]KAA0972146.1 GntR family transcriptional regulator [Aureimonas fodinaquatilis]